MDFSAPTYVILPVQSPIADQILRIRERYGHPLAYPVEVTVAGSSGVGTLEPDQDPEAVVQVLERIAASTRAFQTEFGKVRRFPGTNIFWLSLKDEAPFRELHQRLKESQIRFQPSPFPFQPHCTLQVRQRSEQEATELLRLRVPGSVVFDEIALASEVRNESGQLECPILWRAKLASCSASVSQRRSLRDGKLVGDGRKQTGRYGLWCGR